MGQVLPLEIPQAFFIRFSFGSCGVTRHFWGVSSQLFKKFPDFAISKLISSTRNGVLGNYLIGSLSNKLGYIDLKYLCIHNYHPGPHISRTAVGRIVNYLSLDSVTRHDILFIYLNNC